MLASLLLLFHCTPLCAAWSAPISNQLGFGVRFGTRGASWPRLSTANSNDATPTAVEKDELATLKKELFSLAERTSRGFQANPQDRKRVNELVEQLSRRNPTAEPARAYYADDATTDATTTTTAPSISGKWTLLYTDAPDITSLGQTNPWATLGRIGQECDPPFIRNVIEWKRPAWLPAGVPLSGSESTRILQRVVTKGVAVPSKPMVVDLTIAGLQVNGDGGGDAVAPGDVVASVQTNGLVAGFYNAFPVDLKGPLTAPFGQFTVQYLDEELRIVRTSQGYLAVNLRNGDEWI